ncbi:spermatogenesis-associated protein 17 [Bombus pyrosoma]|uniref:spermatogenesis-associated protein 17 n=1 Tax=Bombus pyrosoma TaxID=396416 RepID=UPI001CB97190|nr:spermatogenesis-associated protein 17 [Bombus pyrosoma]
MVDRYLVHRVHQMWQDYYNEMATRIQAFWRGYWIRKTVLDIEKMRRWLNEVYTKNEETVKNMKRFKQEEIECVQTIIERESMQWILFILFKLHHLLRTKQRPGVFTRIDNTRFTLIEEMLRCLEYKRYMRDKKTKSKRKCEECQIDRKPTLILRGTYYERCEKEIHEIRKNLEAGAVPIYRSEPYEEHEKSIRKLNQMRLVSSIDEAYETSSRRKIEMKNDKQRKVCSLRREFEQQACCIDEADLCEKIKKMDCHLKQLRLKCPIHDPPCQK